MRFHSGPRTQKGRGLGSILSALFRGLAPVAKIGMRMGKNLVSSPLMQKVGATAVEAAKKSAANIAADVIAGNNMKESAQRELNAAKEKIATTLRAGRKRKSKLARGRSIARKKPRRQIKNKKSNYCILD